MKKNIIKKLFTNSLSWVLLTSIFTSSVFGNTVHTYTDVQDLSSDLHGEPFEFENAYSDFVERYFYSAYGNSQHLEYPISLMGTLSMLEYDGDSRIVNNLRYTYVDGRLKSISDAFNNTAYLIYDEESALTSIYFDNQIINIEMNELGFISSYNILGTNIGAKYEFSDYGYITGINASDTKIDIVFNEQNQTIMTFINDVLTIEVSESANNAPIALMNRDLQHNQTLLTQEDEYGIVQTFVYGVYNDIVSASFEFDEYLRITHIDFSNNIELFATYDEFGFSDTILVTENEYGELLNLETTINTNVSVMGGLYAIRSLDFAVNDREINLLFDNRGFIENIFDDGALNNTFAYDNITGQLLREYNHLDNIITIFNYDDFGNILQRTVYSQSGREVFLFEYDNSNWGDQLTAFNGTPIFHDNLGNMTYGIGLSINWDGTNPTRIENGSLVTTFTHNSDGIRTSKTVNGITTTFLLDGDRILAEHSSDGQTIVYLFDHEDSLLGFVLNGDTYFYVTNPLGDIIAIKNSNLEIVVEYRYDAFGNLLEISGYKADTVGAINPFRYRGHRYDASTGLYHIGGRLYSPVLGRFISPSQELGFIGNSISHNPYIFALNNPISNDYRGRAITIKITISGIAFVAATVMTLLFNSQQLQVTMANAAQRAIDALWNSFGLLSNSLVTSMLDKLAAANDAYRNSNQRTPYQNHHIIARSDSRASTARTIYNHYWAPIPTSLDHSRNRVMVRNSLHRRMHTAPYHTGINTIIQHANNGNTNNNGRASQVNSALNTLRAFITSVSNLAP